MKSILANSHKKQVFKTGMLTKVKLPWSIKKGQFDYILTIQFAGHIILACYRCYQEGNYNKMLLFAEKNTLEDSVTELKAKHDKLMNYYIKVNQQNEN